jgi:predicted Zn-dependent protease
MERVSSRDAVRTAYASALRRWPDSVVGAIGLANARYEDGDLAGAESVLRSAAVRHPKSPALLNNLAQVVSDQHRHDEALRMIDEAIAQGGPFAAAAQSTREQILERMGREARHVGR